MIDLDHYAAELGKNWIPISLQKPNAGCSILVVADYTEYGRSRKVYQATTHFAETPQPYGGPNALTGSGFLTGLYYAIPSILAPEIVTHWMPEPFLPENEIFASNNGWTKILPEHDPIPAGRYYVAHLSKKYVSHNAYKAESVMNQFLSGHITHYREAPVFKLPIR